MWSVSVKQDCCWLWSRQASLPLQRWASVSSDLLKVLGLSSSPHLTQRQHHALSQWSPTTRGQLWHGIPEVPPGQVNTCQCLFQAEVCLRDVFFSLACFSPLPSIDHVQQHHKRSVLPWQNTQMQSRQDICKCCLKPNTSPGSEALSTLNYIRLSQESKGEHSEFLAERHFWFVHAV